MEERRHQHRLYWHPQRGWTSDSKGADLRLDARVRTKSETSNLLHRADGKGGWNAISDESSLSASERGLVWYGWPTAAAGQQYLAFKGVRVVDSEVATSLLKGINVYDESGNLLDQAEAAGHIFLLEVEAAREFHKRAKAAGGVIHRGDPMPEAAATAATVIEAQQQTMEVLAAEDALALIEAGDDDFSGRSAFERRHEQYDLCWRRGREASEECERALRPLALPGRTLAEQSQAVAMGERAERARNECETLYERREAAEKEMAFFVARSEGYLPDESSPAQRLLLFRELGRIARATGHETEDTLEGTRIRTIHGWLHLGPGFDFEV